MMSLFNERLNGLPSRPKAIQTDWKGLRKGAYFFTAGAAFPFPLGPNFF
jgi:hypothetical protein